MREIPKDFADLLLEWYAQNARILPWRSDPQPYNVWISEVMLQQTRVEAVKPYYLRFLSVLPDLKSLAEADESTLLKLWEGLGYYNRVRNLQKAAKTALEKYGGLPQTAEELKTLPGIGPYTAGAVASIAFGQPEPAVDGNVMRVITRLLAYAGDISKQKVRREIENALLPSVRREPSAFNQALMELGATVCLPNGAPKCGECPVSGLCQAHLEERELDFPFKLPKKKRKIEQKTIFLLEREGLTALKKRPDSGLLAGLWGFPESEDYLGEEEVAPYLEDAGFHVLHVEPLGEAKHIFSHTEWRMIGYRVLLTTEAGQTCGTDEADRVDIAERNSKPGGISETVEMKENRNRKLNSRSRAAAGTDGIDRVTETHELGITREFDGFGGLVFLETETIRAEYAVPSAYSEYLKFLR